MPEYCNGFYLVHNSNASTKMVFLAISICLDKAIGVLFVRVLMQKCPLQHGVYTT